MTAPALYQPDPLAVSLGQKVATAQQKASAQGVKLSPDDIEQFVREESNGKLGANDLVMPGAHFPANFKGPSDVPSWLSAAGTFGNGFLQHWGPDAVGLMQRVVQGLGGDKGGPSPDQMSASLRGALADYKKDNKWTARGLDVAGGIVPWLAAPELRATGLGSRALVGAGTGAVAGAVNGAGDAGPGNRVTGAITGGAGGALGGAILSPALGAIADKIAGRIPLTAAETRIAQVAAKDPTWQATLQKLQAAGRGDQATVADLSPPLRAEADRVATANSDAFNTIDATTRARAAGQGERLLGDVQGSVGNPIADQQVEQLAASRRAWANSAYDKLRENGKDIDFSALASTLQKPGVQNAWRQAKLAGDIVTDSPADRLFQNLAEQNPEASPAELKDAMKTVPSLAATLAKGGTARPVTFADLQSFDQMLDGRIGTAYRAGNGNLAKAYKTVQDAVVEQLSKDPNYAPVQAEYAQRKGLEEAVQAGVDAWNQNDSRGLATQMAKMSPAEVAQFRSGMASQLITQLRGANTNANQAARLMDASPAVKDKLQTVFGDNATFNKFMAQVDAEAQLARLRGATSGSPTAGRQAAGSNAVSDAMTLLHSGGNPIPLALSMATRMGRQGLADQTRTQAGQIAPMLMTQGSDAIMALLKRLGAPQPGVPGAAAGAGGVAGGAVGRGLLDEQQ